MASTVIGFSNDSCLAVLSCGVANYAVQGQGTLCMKSQRVTIQSLQMKAIEQYFHVVLFIMLYKVVLTFECVDEILRCNHSNKSYWAALSCDAVYYAVQSGSNFRVFGWNPKVWPFK